MNKYFDLGKKLNIDSINKILVENKKLRILNSTEKKIIKSRSFLENKISDSSDKIYGVNTGFGSLCDTEISKKDINQAISSPIEGA